MGRHVLITDRFVYSDDQCIDGYSINVDMERHTPDDYRPRHSVSRFPDTMPDTLWPGLVLWYLPTGGTVHVWRDLTEATISGIEIRYMNPRGTADFRRVAAEMFTPRNVTHPQRDIELRP